MNMNESMQDEQKLCECKSQCVITMPTNTKKQIKTKIYDLKTISKTYAIFYFLQLAHKHCYTIHSYITH